jgi:BRCT domain type II-containing protein
MPISLKDKTIVFTGTLSSMTRNEARGIAYKLGAIVSDSMGVNVDYLVVGDKPGSKLIQVRKYGVIIINERKWNILARVDVAPEYSPGVYVYTKEAPKVYKKTIPPKVNNDFPELDLD